MLITLIRGNYIELICTNAVNVEPYLTSYKAEHCGIRYFVILEYWAVSLS